ncbi:MAG TPA: DUF6152 family protein [Terriglobia bacterium]|nr:DUF6152 family protein [Terriglobia bacterium]
MMGRGLVFSTIGLPVMCVMLFAHHSTVAYSEKPIVLRNATIANVLWASPHIVLTFNVSETSGTVSSWSVETGSPGSVARVGWKRNSVKPNDKVTIELYPARNGAHVGRLRKVIFPDGRELVDTQNPTSLKK